MPCPAHRVAVDGAHSFAWAPAWLLRQNQPSSLQAGQLPRDLQYANIRRHYPPAAGKYVRQYIDSTVPAMAVGEYWDTCEYTDGVLNYNQDSHRQRTVSWCDQTGGTSAAFDFTLKGGHGA